MSYILVDDNYKNKLKRIVTKTFDKDTFVVSTPVIKWWLFNWSKKY